MAATAAVVALAAALVAQAPAIAEVPIVRFEKGGSSSPPPFGPDVA